MKSGTLDLIWVIPSLANLGGCEYTTVTFIQLILGEGHSVRLVTGDDMHPAWRRRLSKAGMDRLKVVEASDTAPAALCARIAMLHAQQPADLVQFIPIEEHCLFWLRQHHSIPVAGWEPTDMSSRCWWLSDQLHSTIHELDLLLVFNPDAARHALQRYGYGGRVQVVPNTLIEFDDASPSIERAGTAPVIGCISRLSAEKGIEYLLASFGLLLEELPDALLDIWGVGEDEGRLRLLAKMLGIESRVRFKGAFEPFSGINAVAAEADVFVLSSLFEGAPVVLLELAALSRPVVATATSGSRWVCGDNYEWLVPIGDTRRMATSLAQLLASDSKRNRAGLELQMRAQAHFSHRQAVSAICSAYCQVAGKVMRK